MLIGGVLALFVRALYRRFGLSVSHRDAFSNVFPLLTISTVLIIFVVKPSFDFFSCITNSRCPLAPGTHRGLRRNRK